MRNPLASLTPEHAQAPAVWVTLHTEHGQSATAIARALGVSRDRVLAELRARGVYQRLHTARSLTRDMIDADAFWAAVDTSPGHGPQGTCWVWTGPMGSTNARREVPYGQVELANGSHGAHRVAAVLAGMQVDDLVVRHVVCAHHPCVRPDHLATGTQADNATDTLLDGHARTKVDPVRAFLIREMWAAGIYNRYSDLSDQFGLTRSYVRQLVQGEARRSVPTPGQPWDEVLAQLAAHADHDPAALAQLARRGPLPAPRPLPSSLAAAPRD